jgi:hypothetical protein
MGSESMSQIAIEDNTATQEHFVRAARTGQEAISSAVRVWGEATQSMFGLTSAPVAVPTVEHLIDGWFDTAEEILRAQREFTEGMLGLGKPAIHAMARAAQQTSEAIEHSAHDIPENVRSTVRQHSKQRSAAHNGA